MHYVFGFDSGAAPALVIIIAAVIAFGFLARIVIVKGLWRRR